MSSISVPNPVAETPPQTSAWRWAFRIFRWSTYLLTLITLALVLHKAPPPPVESSPQAAQRAEEKFTAVEQEVSHGQPATLRLDETELNSYLAAHLDLVPTANTASPGGPEASSGKDVEQMRSSVRDVKLQMTEDRVKAYVVFDVHGKDMTLELEGRLGATGGYLRFEPVSGQIGSLPIPQSTVQSAIQKLMDSPENHEKLRLPAEIADLRIENGELVATYR